MRPKFPELRKDAILRMLADFLALQFSMLCTLAIVFAFYSLTAGASTAVLGEELRHYYLYFFLLASPLLVLVLYLNGTYTVARSYQLHHKLNLVARSIGVGILLILTANYFFLRMLLVARSVTVIFSLFSASTLIGGRIVRAYMTRGPRPKKQTIDKAAPVLVVGGAGYIGPLVCEELLKAGHKVRVLDSLVYGDSAIAHLKERPDFELVTGDCRNIRTVVGAVKGVKAIIHLAAIVGDPACDQDRKNALEINYAATRMLVEIAKGNGIERFLFASSCSVYGATDLLMDENSITQPISIYGQTKLDSEQAILEAESDHFHPTVLRLATVFGLGPRPRFDLVVNLLTARAVCDRVITIFNGEQWRPFIHVRDVARGFAAALAAPLHVVGGQIYNLGDSRHNFTLSEVANQIRKAVPGTRVQNVSNSDRRNYRVSFSKIQREIGFRATLGLGDGIAEVKGAFERGEIVDYSDPWYNNVKALQSIGPLASSEIDTQVMAAFVLRRPVGITAGNAA